MSKTIMLTDTCHLTRTRLYSARHESGAVVQFVYSDTRLPCASVTLPFGGAAYGLRDGKNHISVPAGAAHFLEHMLFNKEGMNECFSALGADVNALTYLSHTCYYFTARRNFFESLDALLGMVLSPSFPESTFEKEREVILRELEEDSGDVFLRGRDILAESIFSRSPLRRDVGGKAADVKALSFAHLSSIADAVCRPSGAVISVVGPFSPELVWKNVSAFLDGLSYRPQVSPRFSALIAKSSSDLRPFRAATETPIFFAALAPSADSLGADKAEDYVFSSLLEDMLFDRSEPFFKAFSNECGMVGVSLFGELDSQSETFGKSGFLSVSAPVSSPLGAAEAFDRTFSSLLEDGSLFCEAHLESKRRGLVADYLSTLDSPLDTCLALGEYSALGASLFDEARAICTLDADAFLKKAKDSLASVSPVFAAGTRSGRV